MSPKAGGSASIGKLGYLGTFQDVSVINCFLEDYDLSCRSCVIERARQILEQRD